MRRNSLHLLLAAVLLLLAGLASAAEPAAPQRPKLVVVLTIDQLRADYLERMRPRFSDEGLFKRMLTQGAVFANCHHAHAFTYTAPGHAAVLTGAHPNVHGIIDNSWYDRDAKREINCVEDPLSPLVGAPDDGKGASPRALRANTLGDELRLITNRRAKVLAVSLKDRGAILPGGHLATGAYWFDPDTGRWITSKYYRDALPQYLRVYNESGAPEHFSGQEWKLRLEPSQYVAFRPDDSPYERDVPGLGRAFPHVLPKEIGKDYYTALATSPFGNEMTLAVAQLIADAESLGKDDVTDLLCVSLSSNDYVGHAYGPYSLEVQDMMLHTDLQLGKFAAFLDEQVGAGAWSLVLTADHGVAPIPEYAETIGLPAARGPIDSKALRARLEDLLRSRLGTPAESGTYIEQLSENQVYLRWSLPELVGHEAEARALLRDELLEIPTVAAAFTRDELVSSEAVDGLAGAFRLACNPLRSGDVFFALTPHSIPSTSLAATHGSPWTYDSHVPLIFYGAGFRAIRSYERVNPGAAASTLAALLRVDPPAACVEEALLKALAPRPPKKQQAPQPAS